MPTIRPGRLGLVCLTAISLVACKRNATQPPALPPGASQPVTGEAASDSVPLPSDQAAAPIATPASASAAAAAPQIADASALDTGAQNGAAEAYQFDEGGQQVQVWTDPSRGWRIENPDIGGPVLSYYQPGAVEPYLLRQGDVFYVMTAGRIVRAYGRDGRVVQVRPDIRIRIEASAVRSRAARRDADRRRPPALARQQERAAGVDETRAEDQAHRAEDRAKDARKDAQTANRRAQDANRPDRPGPASQPARPAAADSARRARNEAGHAEDKAKEARKDAQGANRNAADRGRGNAPAGPQQPGSAAADARQAHKQADQAKGRAQDARKDARTANHDAQVAKQNADRPRTSGRDDHNRASPSDHPAN
jgi:hypothetical protein